MPTRTRTEPEYGLQLEQMVMRLTGKNAEYLRVPLQTGRGGIPQSAYQRRYAFLDDRHKVHKAWYDRWDMNERLLAGGDDVLEFLREFPYEKDMSPYGWYAKRQREAIYTNFPDIYASSITGHLLRFAPRPDQGWSAPELGKVTKRTRKNPSQAEQIWYSVDNPSGAGTEWNQWWMDTLKRAMGTGHRLLYIDSPNEPAVTQQREAEGFRPWIVDWSPLDVTNWYVNIREETEFVIIRFHDDDPRVVAGSEGSFQMRSDNERHYLLLVRAGCTRVPAEFQEGGWFKFDAEKRPYDAGTWDDTFGQIPVIWLYYQRHRGTRMTPAISRPGITELGSAALALMNQTSSANFNSWRTGGGVDYLAGIDKEAFEQLEEFEAQGSFRLPLPPNEETDDIPVVYPSSAGAVQADIFETRENAIWDSAIRLGLVEAMGPVRTTGAASDATFNAGQVPRIMLTVQNLGVAQNEALKLFGWRYGHAEPTGEVRWPTKFNLVEFVDRIRRFFEVERLSGLRSETIDSEAMVTMAEEEGLLVDNQKRAIATNEFKKSAKLREQAEIIQMQDQRMKGQNEAKKDSDREADKKVKKSKGRPGRPGPGAAKSAPGVRR